MNWTISSSLSQLGKNCHPGMDSVMGQRSCAGNHGNLHTISLSYNRSAPRQFEKWLFSTASVFYD